MNIDTFTEEGIFAPTRIAKALRTTKDERRPSALAATR